MQLASGGKEIFCKTCSVLAIFGLIVDQVVLVQVLEAAAQSATTGVSEELTRFNRHVAGLSRKAYREKWWRPYLRRWHHVAFIICDSGHHGSATPPPASATPSHLCGYSTRSHSRRLPSKTKPSQAASRKLSLCAVNREDGQYIRIACSKRQCTATDHCFRCGTSRLRCGEASTSSSCFPRV